MLPFDGDKPVHTCNRDSCENCELRPELNCHFKPEQLLIFYLIALPSLIIGGIGTFNHSLAALLIWLAMIIVFFFVVEIRVLCSHCPHYALQGTVIRCHANFGIPKLWKYRPGPLNNLEKTTLLAGFILIWGYPAGILLAGNNWILLALYIPAVIFFFGLLRRIFCRRCIHFSCPLNNVEKHIRKSENF